MKEGDLPTYEEWRNGVDGEAEEMVDAQPQQNVGNRAVERRQRLRAPSPARLPRPVSPWVGLAHIDTGASRSLEELMECLPAPEDLSGRQEPSSTTTVPIHTSHTQTSPTLATNRPVNPVLPQGSATVSAFKPLPGVLPTENLDTSPPPQIFYNAPMPSNIRNSGPPLHTCHNTPMVAYSHPTPVRPVPMRADRPSTLPLHLHVSTSPPTRPQDVTLQPSMPHDMPYHTAMPHDLPFIPAIPHDMPYHPAMPHVAHMPHPVPHVTPLQAAMYPQMAGYPIVPHMALAPNGMPIVIAAKKVPSKKAPKMVTRGTQTSYGEGSCRHQQIGGPAGSPDTRLKCYRCGCNYWHVDVVSDMNPVKKCKARPKAIKEPEKTEQKQGPRKSSPSDDVILVEPPTRRSATITIPTPANRRYVTSTTVRVPTALPPLSPGSIMVDPRHIFRNVAECNRARDIARGIIPQQPTTPATQRRTYRPRDREGLRPLPTDEESSPEVTYL